MENIKVSVKHNVWSEVFDMLVELGAKHLTVKSEYNNFTDWLYVHKGNIWIGLFPHERKECREVTFQQLKDMVVLKRNSIDDATHEFQSKRKVYVSSDDVCYQFTDDKWEMFTSGSGNVAIKPIEKKEMKEYLDTSYWLRTVKQTSGDNHVPMGWIEVPDGAEILYFGKKYKSVNHFFKIVDGKSYYKYLEKDSEWVKYSDEGLDDFKEIIDNFLIMWQRNPETPNTTTQDKLKFIEKWLNGEKIQYILGVESEKTQWYNFTEGDMRYIKRPDIKFREAPKYVTINGIEFKSVDSLLKYVKNNFDLEAGE